MRKGKLVLLPNHLDLSDGSLSVLPKSLEAVVTSLDGIFVESEKGARRFLKCFKFPGETTFRDVKLKQLNEHSQKNDYKDMLTHLLEGETWGVLSDAGMPCLADPGSKLVAAAKEHQIKVDIYHGPSSITHALILSGFDAQNFSFHGYLPREEKIILDQFKFIEKIVFKTGQTQLFIETPYRNQKVFEFMLKVLHPKTTICVAIDLMTKEEKVIKDTVGNLKKNTPYIPKNPAVFLIGN